MNQLSHNYILIDLLQYQQGSSIINQLDVLFLTKDKLGQRGPV